MSNPTTNGHVTTRALINDRAYERYHNWVRLASEREPYLLCALCEGGGVVTIMAGYAVCGLCRHALASTHQVQEIVAIAHRQAKAMELPFGATEWQETFKNQVRREIKREKAKEKANGIQTPDDDKTPIATRLDESLS